MAGVAVGVIVGEGVADGTSVAVAVGPGVSVGAEAAGSADPQALKRMEMDKLMLKKMVRGFMAYLPFKMKVFYAIIFTIESFARVW